MKAKRGLALSILLLMMGCGGVAVENQDAENGTETSTSTDSQMAGSPPPDTTSSGSHGSHAAPGEPDPLAGFESYPFDFSLPSTEGETVSLADYQGKVLIVDIWGTWCPPCRKEIPHFVALQEKYKDQGFEMVGLNYERVPKDKLVPTIKKFAEDFSINYPCLIGDAATQKQVPGFRGYPTTLFIDRTGKVRAQMVGYHEYERLESIVVKLLEESAAP